MHDIKKSWERERTSDRSIVTTDRKTRRFHRCSNRSCRWSARKRSASWYIVPRWSDTAFTKKRFPWLVQATCIAKPPSLPLVLRPSINFSSPYAWAGRQGTARIRGQFLLGDLLLEFCKHLTWIMRLWSFFSGHDVLLSVLFHTNSISASLAGLCLRILTRLLLTRILLAQAKPEVKMIILVARFPQSVLLKDDT